MRAERLRNVREPTRRAASKNTPVPRADGVIVHSHSAVSTARVEMRHLNEADHGSSGGRRDRIGEGQPGGPLANDAIDQLSYGERRHVPVEPEMCGICQRQQITSGPGRTASARAA